MMTCLTGILAATVDQILMYHVWPRKRNIHWAYERIDDVCSDNMHRPLIDSSKTFKSH